MFVRAALSVILLLMSPIIIICNLLILSTWFRFKRLRTPSNFLIISLSSADLGFGLVLPAAVAVDLTLQTQAPMYNDNSRATYEDLITTTTTTTAGPLIRNVTSSPVAVPGEWTNNDINFEPERESGGVESGDHQQVGNFIHSDSECSDTLCMAHFLILLIFCSAAILSMTAIALDRLMSVAQPLRYNHFVTMKHVQKFVSCYWIYSVFLCSCVPFLASSYKSNPEAHILLLSACIYVPCAILIAMSYLYIYLIARSHARAIYSVEISLNNSGLIQVNDTSSSSSHPRYGLTLACIVSAFILCWSPIQLTAFIDVVSNTSILYQRNWRILLATPVVLSCTINPYLYAYHSSEIRMAIIRTVDAIVTKVTGRPPKIPIFIQDKGDFTSCASNIRLLGVSPTPTQTSAQCSGEPNTAGTTPEPNHQNQNHLNLFLCDYSVTTL